jgi:uroporphyrin-III C-methyltransferase
MIVNKNKVIMAGIGPGDPDLLTVKALKAIQNADVLVYDSEQADQVLELVSPNTKILKINKDRSIPYSEVIVQIVDLIETHYKQGEKVVRLKVGDAFLYGRGATEADEMVVRGIHFDVIPGITSGVAAANLAHIKISEKNEADGVIFYMANQQNDQDGNLRAIVKTLKNGFTLISYMAEGRIVNLVKKLVNFGVPETTIIVAASNVSAENETIRQGTLGEVLIDKSWDSILPQTTFFIGQFVTVIN